MGDEKKSIFIKLYKLIKFSSNFAGIKGLRPDGGFPGIAKRHKYLIFQYFFVAPVIIAEIACFIMNIIHSESIPLIIEAMACSLTSSLTFIKITFMVLNSDRVLKLYNELFKMWPEEPHAEWITKITTVHIWILKRLMYTIHIAYMALVQSIHLKPIVKNLINYFLGHPFDYELPYPTVYPFPLDNNLLYSILFISHFNAGTWVALSFAAADSYLYFCISNLSIQFEILAADITYIVETHHHKWAGTLDRQMDFRSRTLDNPEIEYPYDKDSYMVDHMDDLYETMMSCIKRHTYLIQLVEDLDHIFGFTILMNIVSSSLLICLVGFMAIMSKELTVSEMVEYAISVPTKVLQIFLLCWSADQIITSSAKVADAAISCRWYLTDKRFKTATLLMTLRGLKPVSLNALGFSVVSLLTFSSVIGTSWSYLTLLRTTLQ